MIWNLRLGVGLSDGESDHCFHFRFPGVLDILSGDMPKGIKVQTRHLEALIELHNMTGAFARNIQHLFSESDIHVLVDTLKAVYFPYESFKKK